MLAAAGPGSGGVPQACSRHTPHHASHRPRPALPCPTSPNHHPQALGDLKESSQGLPEQILAEVHFQIQPGHFEKDLPPVAAKNQAQMSLLFMHLANLGYGITSREDNGYQNLGCCSEYSFLRVETTTTALFPEAHSMERNPRRWGTKGAAAGQGAAGVGGAAAQG